MVKSNQSIISEAQAPLRARPLPQFIHSSSLCRKSYPNPGHSSHKASLSSSWGGMWGSVTLKGFKCCLRLRWRERKRERGTRDSLEAPKIRVGELLPLNLDHSTHFGCVKCTKKAVQGSMCVCSDLSIYTFESKRVLDGQRHKSRDLNLHRLLDLRKSDS